MPFKPVYITYPKSNGGYLFNCTIDAFDVFDFGLLDEE